jgi:ribosomal protein S18 acetylase RimI-like enzyme
MLSRTPKVVELLLDGIAVQAETRSRRGGGKHLFEAIFAFAEQQGYTRVHLEVVDSNLRAHQIYERIGFVPITPTSMPSPLGIYRHHNDDLHHPTIEE